jgi:sec-independent protein translocase protein TatA
MFGLGTQELVIILVIVLVIFGAGKLPSVGGALGKGIRNFKKGMDSEEDPELERLDEKKPDPDKKDI